MSVTKAKSNELVYDASNALGYINGIEKKEAKRLNDLGTAAYQKKDYENAIFYYKSAIDLDPDYALAYGNLGLTYQKNGQLAEALWANRKSVSFASSPTIKAGANYNIGRIYEADGEYEKAKQYFQEAKNNVDKPVYDEAIDRMNRHLN